VQPGAKIIGNRLVVGLKLVQAIRIDNVRGNHDKKLCPGSFYTIKTEETANAGKITEKRNLVAGGSVAARNKAAQDHRLAVADRQAGFDLPGLDHRGADRAGSVGYGVAHLLSYFQADHAIMVDSGSNVKDGAGIVVGDGLVRGWLVGADTFGLGRDDGHPVADFNQGRLVVLDEYLRG